MSGTSTGLTVNAASVAIEDNDEPKIILDIKPFLDTDPDKLPESAGATRVTVTAGTTGGVFDLDRQIHVTVGKEGDSAVFGPDYDTPSVALHVLIEAGDTEGEKTFTLTPADDVIVEGDESLTLQGSAAGLEVTSATITIEDNDEADMTLSASPARLSEGAGPTAVTVTVSTGGVTFPADRTVAVTVGDTGDSAVSGADYAPVADFDIPITAGQSRATGTFTLTPTGDTLLESDETITVSGTTAGLTVDGARVTLTDDDRNPAVYLSVAPSEIGETAGDTAATVTAAFSNRSTFNADKKVRVRLGATGDSAVAGTDYEAVAAFEVTIGAGRSSGTATFTLTPIDDTLIEGSERITVAGSNAELTVHADHITLTDDEAPPTIDLRVVPGSVAEGAGATTVTVSATYLNSVAYPDDKTVRVSVGAAGDSAVPGVDYAAVPAFDVTIASGETSGSATFTLTPTDDTLVEGDETIGVSGTHPELPVLADRVTLTDDDAVPAINLSAAPSTVAENAGATAVAVTATFSTGNTYGVDTTVTVSVGEAADDAVSGTDYAAVEAFAIVIAAGQTVGSGSFTLTPIDDTVVEADEIITIGGASTGLVVNGTTVTVTDDELGAGKASTAAINLSVVPERVSEAAGATATTVTAAFSGGLTYARDTTVTVAFGSAADDALPELDYAAVPGFEVTIAAGETSGRATIKLAPVDDGLVEGDETITVSGTHADLSVTPDQVTLVDDDEAPVVDLSIEPSKVSENAGATAMTVTATLSNSSIYAAATTVTVTVGDGADTAVSGTDYASVADLEVTIAEGERSGNATFTLTPIDDALVEGDETVSVEGSAAGLAVNGTDFALADDDAAPAIALTIEPSRVAEAAGDTAMTVTAAFSNASTYVRGTTVTVTVGDAADSAASGADYVPVADFEVTIPAGETSGNATFTLTPVADTLVEGDEAITVSGTNADLTVSPDHVTLTDDDQAPAIALSIGPSSVAEGAGDAAMTVTAAFSNASTYARATTVAVTVGDAADSAASGADYVPVAGFEVTIPAGETSADATFTLGAVDDTLVEGDETVSVAGSAAGLAVNGTAFALADDDAAPRVDLSIGPASVAEGAGDAAMTVTAAFSNASTYARDTTVAVTVGDAADSAASGADYVPVADFEVTIPAGATSAGATFTLGPVADTLVEGDETVSVAGSAAGLAVNGTAFALADDDAAPEIALSIGPSSVAEGAGDAAMTVTAAFSNASTYAQATTVAVTVGDAADSAAAGADYVPVAGFEVTIPAGETSADATFTLGAVDDTLVEGDETVSVAGSAAGLAVNGTAFALADDDAAPEIALSIEPSSLAEGAGDTAMTVTATFSNASTYARGTAVAVTVGDAADSAAAGADYVPVAGFEVTIPAGETRADATFTLSPVDDTLVEGDETITVSGTNTDLKVSPDHVTLTDDDAVPMVALSIGPSSVAEGAGDTAMTVTAAFSNASTYASGTTVAVTVGDAEDSAASGADYVPVADFEVTIPAGETSGNATFTLTPVDDTLVEGDETVSVAGSAAGLAVHGTAFALADDDAAPEIALSIGPSSLAEGAGDTAMTVTATFSNASTYARGTTVAVTVGDAADSAASGADYVPVAGFEVTIPAGETRADATFTLSPVDDTLVEGDETITVWGTNADLTVSPGQVTLADDDAVPAIALSIGPSSVAEGAGDTAMTVTAAFSNASTYASGTAVAVTVGDGADAAMSGTDYASVADFEVAIPAGETSGNATFTLTPVDDTLVEGDETITVAGSAAGLAVNTTAFALADDDAAPEIALSIEPSRVAEDAGDAAMTVTATFSNASTYASGTTVKVMIGDAADSAVSGTDYVAVADFELTIGAGRSTGSAGFVLSTTNDDLYEADEVITVSGSAELAVNGAQATLTDDDRIRDPVAISVADAGANEGDPLIFAVRLNRSPVVGPVSVRYRTEDGTATADSDYAAAGGSLVFQPGETEATVAVQTLDDELSEDSETVVLRLHGANAVLEDDVGIGLVADDDPLSSAWIARFGRTASTHVMDAVETRLRSADRTGLHVSLGGLTPTQAGPTGSVEGAGLADAARGPQHAMPGNAARGPNLGPPSAPGTGFRAAGGTALDVFGPNASPQRDASTTTASQILVGSAFMWTGETDTETEDEDAGPARRWTVWGRGATTRFGGWEDGVSLNGDVVGATLGVDVGWQRWTAGMALARNRGSGTYADAASGRSGRLKTMLTSIHPYARWAGEKTSLWGLVGHGQGDYGVVAPDGDGRAINTDLRMSMAGMGAYRSLATVERLGRVDLALRSDAMFVGMHADPVPGYLRETSTRTSHARLYLEGTRELLLGTQGSVLTPVLELGLRYDAGDAETGAGLEVATRIAYENPARGLRLEAHGRRLFAHQARGLEIWGAGGSIVVDTGGNGLGLLLRLRPTWGAAPDGGADPWEMDAAGVDAPGIAAAAHGSSPGRLDADVGYGFRALGGRGIFTLASGSSISMDGARTFNLGGTLAAGAATELSLRGEHRARPDGEAEFGFVLRAQSAW